MARKQSPFPVRHRLALAAAASLSLVSGAQAAAIVVDTVITLSNNPAVGGSYIYVLPETDTLTVTPTGAIVAPPITGGAAISLAGSVTNQGQLRAAWGTEVQGLAMGGSSNFNQSGALIETYSLFLHGQMLTNRGDLRTGIFTLPDGRALTAFTFPSGGADIAPQASLLNEQGTGRWDSFSNVVVQGSFLNDGVFNHRRNSITAPAAPASYTPEFTVWQYQGLSGQAYVRNGLAGSMSFGDGTRADNSGLILNQGDLRVEPGAWFDNRPTPNLVLLPGQVTGRFDNSGRVLVGDSGTAPAAVNAAFRNEGHIFNNGQFIVQNAGRLENRGSFENDWNGRLEVGRGGSASFTGGVLNNGAINVDGNLAVQDGGTLDNRGVLSVRSGGLFSVDRFNSAMLTSGTGLTRVAGSLLVFGEFGVQGNGATFNPSAPGLDVFAGADVSVSGPSARLVVSQAGSLRNAGSITLSSGGTLHGDVGASIENHGEVNVQPGSVLLLEGNWDESFANKAGGTLDVSGQVTGGAQSRLINEGSMVVRTGGSVSVPDVQHLAGQLTIEAGATLATPGGRLTMTGGQLGGHGTINGDAFIIGNAPIDPANPTCAQAVPFLVACFTPGSSPGHMDITGDLTMAEGSVLELEIERDASGALQWDSVAADSMSFLQGSLIRVLIGDTAPGAGIEFVDFLNCLTSACDFGGASFEVRGGQGGNFSIGDDGSLGFALAPVPEPGSSALLLAGMGVVGFLARRRGKG